MTNIIIPVKLDLPVLLLISEKIEKGFDLLSFFVFDNVFELALGWVVNLYNSVQWICTTIINSLIFRSDDHVYQLTFVEQTDILG